jgi:tetratricopeptide (TPR) repeat protein
MDEGGSAASQAWRDAMVQEREAQDRELEASTPARRRGLQPDEWERVDEGLEHEANDAVARGRAPTTGSHRHDDLVEVDDEAERAQVRGELLKAVGANRVDRYEQRLKDASRAYRAERYQDALRIVRKLADDAPSSAAVRELHGLTLYRMGRWRAAIRELEAFRTLSDSTEQHPVLADSYRAVHQHDMVRDLWDELRAASPSAPLVTEGRIVMAGSQADQGDVPGAVRTLEQGFTFPKKPLEHHLRRAYALADAYERAGDVVRARDLFARVASHDRDFADVVRRSRALR